MKLETELIWFFFFFQSKFFILFAKFFFKYFLILETKWVLINDLQLCGTSTTPYMDLSITKQLQRSFIYLFIYFDWSEMIVIKLFQLLLPKAWNKNWAFLKKNFFFFFCCLKRIQVYVEKKLIQCPGKPLFFQYLITNYT